MFDGANPANNATIIYIDVDSTAGTGAKHMAGVTPELSDSGNHLRQLVTNSGFNLNASLIAQGIGFDAAVIIDSTDTLNAARAFGFGTNGVSGSTSSFADLQGTIAYARGNFGPGAPGTTISGPSAFEVSIPLSRLGNA